MYQHSVCNSLYPSKQEVNKSRCAPSPRIATNGWPPKHISVQGHKSVKALSHRSLALRSKPFSSIATGFHSRLAADLTGCPCAYHVSRRQPNCRSSDTRIRSLSPEARPEARDEVSGPSEVVCVGEALFDLISQQPGLPREHVTRWDPHAGGAPCNVATALARLGVRTSFVTALGSDAMGRQLLGIMKSRGVKTHACQLLESAPTRDVFVTRSSAGERHFSGFGGPTDGYADCFIAEDSVPWDELKGSKLVVMGTLGLAYAATAKSMRRIIREVRAMDAAGGGTGHHLHRPMVLVDVNWRDVFWAERVPDARGIILDFLKKADIIKLSDADLVALLNLDPEVVLQHPELLADTFPLARCILLTAGAGGSGFFVRSTTRRTHNGAETARDDLTVSGYMPAFKVNVVDTTGAGDAFTAAFTYKLLQAGGLDKMVASLLSTGGDVSVPPEAWLPADASGAAVADIASHQIDVSAPAPSAPPKISKSAPEDGAPAAEWVSTRRHCRMVTTSPSLPPIITFTTETTRKISRRFHGHLKKKSKRKADDTTAPAPTPKFDEKIERQDAPAASEGLPADVSNIVVPSIWEAVLFASAAGAAACCRPGAMESQPTLSEAEDLVRTVAGSQVEVDA